ncbi:neprilysin-3-like [Teleopsis dalmanni]|uniref:neprilysin-3-like n=1 Tax=Teleopsis dalmanni TaxID=139649 RepID=UPI0018CCDD23|nr:neprilysin-3-like [Teleopsis dalmanni]
MGNRSILTTISGQITASQRSGNDINNVTSKQYNPHLIGVQSKFRRKYYHKALLGLLIFTIIILIITIIIISLKHKRSATICRTNECIRTAANLLYSMDEQTDPCEDFYTFTCGRWANEHPRPDSITSNDWFRESQAKIMRKVRSFLQANVSDAEPSAVAKIKVMYKACINTELLDDRELEPLVEYLREFELPLLPSGFNMTLSKEAEKKFGDIEKFNWLRALVNIKKFTGMDLIIGFDIFADPLNNTIKRIAFGTPESESSLPFNNDDMHKLLHKVKRKKIFNQDDDDDMESREEEEEESAKHTSAGLTAYVTYVKHILEAYILYLNPDTKSEEIEDTIGDMALKAVKVARRIFRLKEDAENATKPMKNPAEDIVYISVIDLQNQTDKLIAPKTIPIWEEYLQLIMNNTNHTKPFNSKDIKIITSQADIIYLQTITEYLFDVAPEDIEFYIWLSVVEELILHTTSDMRLLHTEYMRVMIGTEGSSPRSIYCAHAVNSLMGMAVSYSLADKNFTLRKLPKVENMLKDIRLAFEKLVRSTNWMDAETKRQTLQKSAEMKSFIGFPDWLTNATELNEYYEGVYVNETKHLENMIGVLRWQMQTRLDGFYEPEVFGWATSPSNVNAFHTFQSNAITIPIAILQYPFYDLGLE